MRTIAVPDLPPWQEEHKITLSEATKLVAYRRTRRIRPEQLRRWCIEGTPIADVRVLFPAIPPPGPWLTCAAWCVAFNRFVERLRAEAARRFQDAAGA